MDMYKLMNSLAKIRPIFHSEADFQHALAWEMRSLSKDCNIRLEYVFSTDNRTYHIDILLIYKDYFVPIELKYKTIKSNFTVNGEQFSLRNHGAQDIGRYDYIKDICRVESVLRKSGNKKGYAIILSNDSSYWLQTSKRPTVDSEFRIHNDRVLNGTLAWGDRASAGTMKNREMPLTLDSTYRIKWHDYSNLWNFKGGLFRFAIVEVINGS